MTSYLISFLGGLFLGLATIIFLYSTGKIAGISGLVAESLNAKNWFKMPAFWFLLGLVLLPLLYAPPSTKHIQLTSPYWLLILSGTLVGLGTRMGSGCTSGHGICGISRLSKRSFIAVICFMFSALLTVQIVQFIFA